ncbi:GNAT family N-acetyltransferase [Asanoa siamensis]|nr:GNAT family protein [Asanoa siamensis]
MLLLDLGAGASLRALEPWHAPVFATFAEENRADFLEFLPWADFVRDEATAREFLTIYARRAADDSGRIYGLWQGGALVGGTLFRVFDTALSTAEIGVWLMRSARGQGLVSRAARQMIDWACDERGIRRVEWRCAPHNANSIAVAKRLGFRLEGTLREAFVCCGQRQDVQVWSQLAQERGRVEARTGHDA